MKAFLIDTPNKQITEVEYNGDWKTIKQHIHADCFTVVYIDPSVMPDCVFVDDEGLINGNPHGWFKIGTYEQPLRGYGLVLGTDADGDSVSPNITLERLQRMVTFHDDSELDEPESYAHTEVRSFDSAEDFLAALGIKP